MPVGKPKFWTKGRLAALAEHAEAGKNRDQIAVLLGTTPKAIKSACTKHRVSLRPIDSIERRPPAMTPEVQRLSDLFIRGKL